MTTELEIIINDTILKLEYEKEFSLEYLKVVLKNYIYLDFESTVFLVYLGKYFNYFSKDISPLLDRILNRENDWRLLQRVSIHV